MSYTLYVCALVYGIFSSDRLARLANTCRMYKSYVCTIPKDVDQIQKCLYEQGPNSKLKTSHTHAQ